ncbi:hypothetical protein [Parabacteroides sp.]
MKRKANNYTGEIKSGDFNLTKGEIEKAECCYPLRIQTEESQSHTFHTQLIKLLGMTWNWQHCSTQNTTYTISAKLSKMKPSRSTTN